jgi:hypothetical protein
VYYETENESTVISMNVIFKRVACAYDIKIVFILLGWGRCMKVDGYFNFPPLSLSGNQLIDLTLSSGFFGFSWSPGVVSGGGNSQYVGVRAMSTLAATSSEITKNIRPKFAGSNPAEAVGFFGRKNPQHAFHRRGSKAICPMSQVCGMLKNPTIIVEVAIVG